MNFAICEDNEKERNILVDLLHKYFEERKLPLPEIYEYENAETMLEAKQGFSILFLDVELEGISGLSAGERLRKMNNRIIIFVVTSHDDYLDDAFDLHAFRYMTKPVNEARLFRSLDIAMELYKSLSKTISLETKDGKVVNLLSSDIIMVEALSRKVTFYTTDGDYQAAKSVCFVAGDGRGKFRLPQKDEDLLALCFLLLMPHPGATGGAAAPQRLCARRGRRRTAARPVPSDSWRRASGPTQPASSAAGRHSAAAWPKSSYTDTSCSPCSSSRRWE